MALPTTRTEFKDYCLRKLGHPVIQINVSDEQVEDRIDEALSYYADFHFDGTQKTFFKKQITAQDKTNRYIEIPENILGVVNIFSNRSILSSGMFSANYQFVFQNIQDLTNYDTLNFTMTMQYMRLLEETLTGQIPIRYNRHVNRLYLDMDWDRLEIGEYVVAECYEVVDPDVFADVWKDRWLASYATAKIQYQWGSILSKFEGMQMAGGVQFNGQLILQEAKEEIQKLEEQMTSTWSLPTTDMIG